MKYLEDEQLADQIVAAPSLRRSLPPHPPAARPLPSRRPSPSVRRQLRPGSVIRLLALSRFDLAWRDPRWPLQFQSSLRQLRRKNRLRLFLAELLQVCPNFVVR